MLAPRTLLRAQFGRDCKNSQGGLAALQTADNFLNPAGFDGYRPQKESITLACGVLDEFERRLCLSCDWIDASGVVNTICLCHLVTVANR